MAAGTQNIARYRRFSKKCVRRARETQKLPIRRSADSPYWIFLHFARAGPAFLKKTALSRDVLSARGYFVYTKHNVPTPFLSFLFLSVGGFEATPRGN